MSGPKGILALCDPPNVYRGFVDGQECVVALETGVWRCIYHKGKNGSFDWIERVEELCDAPSPKSG